MQAIRYSEHGGPEVLHLEDVPTPTPGPGQVRVRLEAIGVNFVDVYNRKGLYPGQLPATPGSEGAGVVDEVGQDVANLRVGDRVAFPAVPGAYAQYIVAPADKVVLVPEGVDTRVAGAVMMQGMTAHYLTHSTYRLQPGSTALVHAAAGGAGALLVQIAKLAGAWVAGTVSIEEKAQIARQSGADAVIRYTEQDFETETRRLTDGKGVDVVYDSVGKTTFDQSLNCLKPRGYLVLFGQSSGPVPPFDPQRLNGGGSLFLTRPTLGHYVADRNELLWRAGDLFSWIAAGELDVRVGGEYPLADAARAHEDLAARRTTGKLLLIPSLLKRVGILDDLTGASHREAAG